MQSKECFLKIELDKKIFSQVPGKGISKRYGMPMNASKINSGMEYNVMLSII